MMRAVVYERYGSPDVVELRDVDRPVPAADQVLVRVHAAAVNPYDWHMMRGEPYLLRLGAGLRKPKSGGLGGDVAGVVEAVGAAVTRFKAGDEVFGLSIRTLAEHVRVAEEGLVPKPANVSFEEAAAIGVAGSTALQGLRTKGKLEAGQTVLIVGASGGVGTFAVQIAKALGAEVTAVCSTRNVELVRSIGADHVVDYTREDVTRSGLRYDLVLDCAGRGSLGALLRVLRPGGTLVVIGAGKFRWLGPLFRLIRGALVARLRGQRVTTFMAQRNTQDLAFLRRLVETGKVRPVIDRTYPLGEASEALRYLESEHARGKVIVKVV